jgi:hypothetical protein
MFWLDKLCLSIQNLFKTFVFGWVAKQNKPEISSHGQLHYLAVETDCKTDYFVLITIKPVKPFDVSV